MVAKPKDIQREKAVSEEVLGLAGLHELQAVKAFGHVMDERGVHSWWTAAMGWKGNEDFGRVSSKP